MMWEEIACRSVLGELNALVEWELQILASKSNKSPKVKLGTAVFELNFAKIIKTIEISYQIKIREIDSYIAIKRLREKVNSFKHRKGFKNPSKERAVDLERLTVDRNEAFQSIDSVKTFLRDLWSKTNEHQKA